MSVLSPPFGARPREDQFLADLANLFRRHRVRTGSPEYLPLLASVLEANDPLRTDLLMLCNAISRMAESDLTPEELLQLLAKAVAGPRSQNDDIAIPEDLRDVFIRGWHKWQARAESLSALYWGDGAEDPAVETDLEKRSIGKFAAAATRKIQATLDKPPIAAEPEITPETRIGELTISQLRSYLDEIEEQVDRLRPYVKELQEILPEVANAPAANLDLSGPAGHGLRDQVPSVPIEPSASSNAEPSIAGEGISAPARQVATDAVPLDEAEEEPTLRLPLRKTVREDELDAAGPTLFRTVTEPQRGPSRIFLWFAAAAVLGMPAAYYAKAYLYPAPATMPLTAPAPPAYAPPQGQFFTPGTESVGTGALAPQRSARPAAHRLLPRAIEMEAQAARAQGDESKSGADTGTSPAPR